MEVCINKGLIKCNMRFKKQINSREENLFKTLVNSLKMFILKNKSNNNIQMTREEFAKLLNGREYRDEISDKEQDIAKNLKLLIIFGASDDLMEFRGILYDELGAYDGTNAYIYKAKKGLKVINEEDYSDIMVQLDDLDIEIKSTRIEAIYGPSHVETTWLMQTNLPHSTFDIMEDGEVYCKGIVIEEKDILAALV